jgi:hypothetical protein
MEIFIKTGTFYSNNNSDNPYIIKEILYIIL